MAFGEWTYYISVAIVPLYRIFLYIQGPLSGVFDILFGTVGTIIPDIMMWNFYGLQRYDLSEE